MLLITTISLIYIISSSISAPANCNCRSLENLDKTQEHLKLATKISAMKLVSSLRELLHQTSQERIYALETTRYDVIKDLQNTYGKLITHTDFNQHFDELIKEIRRILNEEKIPESQELQKIVTEAVEKALSGLLPSAFLCLSMGECISASSSYTDCMASHAHKWTIHFGKEPEKMARRIYQSIARYKLIEKRLSSLQSLLLTAEKTITPICVEKYTNLTHCANCLADKVTYCRNSCEEVAANCYLGIGSDWDENIEALEHLAKDFTDGFYGLEKGIHSSLRRLVETTSPHLARDVVEVCGALSERSFPTRASFLENVRPTVIAKKSEKLVYQLLAYRGHWKRISKNFCTEPSTDNFCWTGTNIVRSQDLINELPPITKDVRPRPIDPRISEFEGSGRSVAWSDDEDLVEGSGSGNGPILADNEAYAKQHDIFATPSPIPFETYSSSALPPTTLTPLYVDSEVIEITESKPDAGGMSQGNWILLLGFLTYWFY